METLSKKLLILERDPQLDEYSPIHHFIDSWQKENPNGSVDYLLNLADISKAKN